MEGGWVARDFTFKSGEKLPELRPTSGETRGHGTHSRAVVWKNYLLELLRQSEPRGR